MAQDLDGSLASGRKKASSDRKQDLVGLALLICKQVASRYFPKTTILPPIFDLDYKGCCASILDF